MEKSDFLKVNDKAIEKLTQTACEDVTDHFGRIIADNLNKFANLIAPQDLSDPVIADVKTGRAILALWLSIVARGA